MFHSSHKSEVEASTEAVLQKNGRTTAVKTALRDDGHSVTQQVCLIHVMGGHDHCSPCHTGGKKEDQIKLVWKTVSKYNSYRMTDKQLHVRGRSFI